MPPRTDNMTYEFTLTNTNTGDSDGDNTITDTINTDQETTINTFCPNIFSDFSTRSNNFLQDWIGTYSTAVTNDPLTVNGVTAPVVTIGDCTWTADSITLPIDRATINTDWVAKPQKIITTIEQAKKNKDEFSLTEKVIVKGTVLLKLLERIEELEQLNTKLEKYAEAELAEEWEKIMKTEP